MMKVFNLIYWQAPLALIWVLVCIGGVVFQLSGTVGWITGAVGWLVAAMGWDLAKHYKSKL